MKPRTGVRAEYEGREFQLGDLSTSGAFIKTPQPAAVGAEVDLRLVGERLLEPIELVGLVRRSDRGIGMGVEFMRVKGAAQVRLEVLLATISVARILVVAGDEVIQQTLEQALGVENYDFMTATDGRQALAMAPESQPDLVILDLDLSGIMTGLRVLQQLRSIPRLAPVPIVVVSASSETATFGAAQKLGAVGCFPKSLQTQKLITFVRSLLEQ